MKKTTLILTLAAVAASFSAWALPVKMVSFADGPGTGGGGEFKATIWDVTPNPDVALYKWNTFCLEKSIGLSYNKMYDFTLDDSRVYAGGPDGGADVPAGDPISIGTAFLYSEFLSKVLPYAYLNPVQRETDASYLQVAFWWLENEITLTAAQKAGNPFLQYADTKLAGDLDALRLDNNGAYRVGVLNVWDNRDQNNPDRQSVLIGLPDGGATWMLLGLGLGSLAFLRRK